MNERKKDGKRGSGALRALGAILILLLIVSALAATALIVAFAQYDAPTGRLPADGLAFEVRSGETGDGVARRLEREGAIRSSLQFRVLVRLRGAAAAPKAGTYTIRPTLRASEILALLASGRQDLVRITIPEGLALSKVAMRLEAAGIAGAESFRAAATEPGLLTELGIPAPSAEGYLFPDTYLFERNTSGERVLKTMVGAFREVLALELPEALELSAADLHERVVLASIVEREYRAPDEARLMAGVFYNRLKIRMPLQSCATVVYVITEELGKPHPEVLLYRDLEIPSPFNTYRSGGLPPAPIANPGLVALDAALRPATTDYLYFRLVDSAAGRHKFSVTYDEHEGAAPLAVKRPGE